MSPCICLGYEAVFQCIVTGGIATIWRGTAFDQCPNDRITLRHGEFNQPGYSQNCGGSGLIIGRAVSVMNGSYTSQLVVNVSQGIIGANVECASDSGSHVGTKQIQLTTGVFQSILCTFISTTLLQHPSHLQLVSHCLKSIAVT